MSRSLSIIALLSASGAALAQNTDLAGYFGFDDPRIIVVDDDMGPALSADLDQDGLTDLVVVNDRKSRIEVYRQRRVARTEAEMERSEDVNELSKSPYYDRVDISVGHAITGFRVHDVDGDGRLDILYAGIPNEVVYMRQTAPMTFEVEQKRRVRGLAAHQDGFNIADVQGDAQPELCVIVDGQIQVFDLTSDGVTGEPTKLGSGGNLAAFFVEDFNGDALQDICAIVPDDDSPIRLWTQRNVATGRRAAKDGLLGAEMRFEMPGLIEAEPVRFDGQAACSLAVVERASRRMVLYDFATEEVEPLDLTTKASVERDVTAEVIAFNNEDGERSIITADIDADGLDDLLVTDTDANAVVFYKQGRRTGFDAGTPFSAFKEPKAIGVGQWDRSKPLEVFVLSEEEKTVGVSTYDPASGRLSFPQPIPMATPGATPVAMGLMPGEGTDTVAVVVRDRRDHTIEFHTKGEEPITVELKDVNRPPQSMLAGDFNADGAGDLLLFTPNEPLVMLAGSSTGYSVLTGDTMPQFGLVQAAGPTNTASLDVDADGVSELLIADENFVRACAFDDEAGWRVVDQITLPDPSSQLTSIATMEDNGRAVIVASDQANRRLVMMAQNHAGAWDVVENLALTGIQPTSITAGRFTGDDAMSVLAFAPDAFGLVRLSGDRVALDEFASYRSDKEDRLEHEIEFGDVNADGYIDMIVLDAREQMCQIYTLSASRKLYFATEFKVFETRLFNRGNSRTFEPSAVIIDDLTGDGLDDLVLEVHDRYIIYPQMDVQR